MPQLPGATDVAAGDSDNGLRSPPVLPTSSSPIGSPSSPSSSSSSSSASGRHAASNPAASLPNPAAAAAVIDGFQRGTTGDEAAGPSCRVCQSAELDIASALPPRALSALQGSGVDLEHYAACGPQPVCGKSYYDRGKCMIFLNCSCRGDLGLAHYACALRWFAPRGSADCEICGETAKNVRSDDLLNFLPTPSAVLDGNSNRDNEPFWILVSAPRRRQAVYMPGMGLFARLSPYQQQVVKRCFEITAAVAATVLLGLTYAKLLGSIGKAMRTAGVNYIVGFILGAVTVIWLKLCVLPRIHNGPTRYWTILLFFWILIFMVWGVGSRLG
eukprot:jgi/Chlat1/3229/Chrsp22S03425